MRLNDSAYVLIRVANNADIRGLCFLWPIDDNGEVVSQEPEYEDETGTITFNDDGTFTWHEDQSDYGIDMVFEWVP